MPEALQQLLIAVVGASFGGGLVGIYLARSQRRKLNADSDASSATATKVITDAALQIVEPLRKALAETTAQAEAAEAAASHARQETAAALAEVAELRALLERYRATYGPL